MDGWLRGKSRLASTRNSIKEHAARALGIGRILWIPVRRIEAVDEIVVILARDRYRSISVTGITEAAIHEWKAVVAIRLYGCNELEMMSHLMRGRIPDCLTHCPEHRDESLGILGRITRAVLEPTGAATWNLRLTQGNLSVFHEIKVVHATVVCSDETLASGRVGAVSEHKSGEFLVWF